MRTKIKYALTLFCFVSLSQMLMAQVYKKYETQLALIVKLTSHITWPADTSSSTFNIGLLSDDEALNNAFRLYAQKRKINEKPVVVNVFNQIDDQLFNNQLVFISQNKKGLFESVFDKAEGKPILLISDSFDDKKLVMINFFSTSDNKLNFEVNKANIINQQLLIDDELLLVGGSMIDVAELYRNSQQSLRSMAKELEKSQALFDTLNHQLIVVERDITTKNQTIDQQKSKIETDKQQIQFQLFKIQQQIALIDSQAMVLDIQKADMANKHQSLQTLKSEFNQQKLIFDQENIRYLGLTSRLDSLNQEILTSERVLGQQSLKITRQQQFIVFFVSVIVLTIILLVIIYIALRNNRKKSMLLEAQKAEIQEINHEVQASNEELNEKNEELFSTLDKLKNTQNQLVHTEKMASLGVLTAGIAHELNNPLNFVYGGVNNIIRDMQDVIPVLAKMRELDPNSDGFKASYHEILELIEELEFFTAVEAIQETIQDIKIGADRAIEIVRGLRNFSRSDKEEWQEMDIHDSINDVLILLQNRYKNKVVIIKQFASDISKIQCKRDKINQALMNIINNAIDAIPDKGTITIKTTQEKETVSISIKDDGVGIAEDLQQKIFDPFYSTKKVGEGVGLGLSITFSAIEMHKGNIIVNSKPTKGCEFVINLPVNQD